MSFPPPYSLECREIHLVVPRKSREIPANSLSFVVKLEQRKSSLLAFYLDTLPLFSLIGKRAVRLPPPRSANETRRESDQLTNVT
jgi:hypothetical protein